MPAATVIRRVCDGVLSLVWAPRCAACDHWLDEPTRGAVCAACWAAVARITPPRCDRCGAPLPSWRVISRTSFSCARCRRAASPIAQGRSAGLYTGTLVEILHAFKYQNRRSLSRRLAALMREAGADLLRGADCAVPVPLHASRLRERGFNQSADLARHLGLPVVNALRRTRATSPQTALPAARRRRNVVDAFAPARDPWRPWPPARLDRWIVGRSVVLVDDVTTTGATLEACAKILVECGAREVRALTVARA